MGAPNSRYQRLSRLLGWLALFALVMLFVSRAVIYETDHQIANLAGILCGIISGLSGYLSLWLSQAIPLKWKLLSTFLPVLLAGVFFLCFEYVGVTGEVLPSYRLRDFLRNKPPVRPQRPDSEELVISDAIRSYEFTQYLGNQRTGIVSDPSFSMAWDRNLPIEVWRKPIGAGWSGFSVADGIAVTLEQIQDQESLTAMSLVTGQTLWQVKRPGKHFHPLGGLGPRSTPTLVKDHDRWMVIALTATGHLLCADLGTGTVRWEQQLLEIAQTNQTDFEAAVNWGRAASPLVYKDRVVVPLGGAPNGIKGSLMACSLEDGSVIWTQGKSQISYSSPVLMNIRGVEQIVSVNQGDVTGHAWDDGRVLWTTSWPSSSNGAACASQPVQIDGNKILVGKGYSQGSKLFEVIQESPEDKQGDSVGVQWITKDIWANSRILKTKFTSSIYFEGKLYGLSDGILECVDPADGTRVWRGQRYGQGQALVVNGALIICSEDGRVIAVDRETGKPIQEVRVLEGVTWNIFAVAGPYLLVRNGTEAVCLTSPVPAQ